MPAPPSLDSADKDIGGAASAARVALARTAWLLIFILASLSLTARVNAQVPAPRAIPSQSKPAILNDVALDAKLGDTVPADLAFKDEYGADVQLSKYYGRRPIILALVYYRCPMLCTMVLNDLSRSMNALEMSAGSQFDVLTISFDPRETTELAAAKKRQYLIEYRRGSAETGWHFLTGPQASIDRLTRAVGFRYTWDAPNQMYAHPSGIMVLTPEGKLSRYFYGIDYAPNDLRLAILEAGENKVATTVTDRVLLYCFHYDPTTGKYGLLISRVLQAGGGMTVLALGGFVLFMVRRDRRGAGALLHGFEPRETAP